MDLGTFERGELRSKGHGKKSVHFNGSDENIELLFHAVISANQLSEDFGASEKPEAPDHLETMEIPTAPPAADPHADEQPQRKPVARL